MVEAVFLFLHQFWLNIMQLENHITSSQYMHEFITLKEVVLKQVLHNLTGKMKCTYLISYLKGAKSLKYLLIFVGKYIWLYIRLLTQF